MTPSVVTYEIDRHRRWPSSWCGRLVRMPHPTRSRPLKRKSRTVRIVVTTDPDAVTLDEPDEFGSFEVFAPAGTADHLDARLGPVGHYDGEHVWVDREALAVLAGTRATDPDWRNGLTAMVEYARDSGFLSDDGTAIRAHVAWEE
jgi:hypothetical protein